MHPFPTFSIVTPSFNQAKFIGHTIESVISQAGEFFIEYVVADGGSTDGSVEVVRSFERSLSDGSYSVACRGVRFRWWSRKDAGQSDAINQGFRQATGDYVAWLNSDDAYLPGAFREVAVAMERSPGAGMVYSNWAEIDAEGRELRRHVAAPFDLDFELNCGNLIPQPAVFMRKSALDDVGLLDVKYHYAMDYDLWIRIGRRYPAVYVDALWASFRMHGESKTVALADRFWREEREIVRKHGGRFFSRMYAKHLERKYPIPMRLVFRLERALALLARGELRELGTRLKRNARTPPPPVSP